MRCVPLLLVAFALAVAGCATAPPTPIAGKDTLFHDALFAPPSKPVRAADVFALSDAMKHYLDVVIAPQVLEKGRQRALFDALYSANQLKLDYDAAITRTASEAFASRSGNCLSLTIMTAALAKELGLDAHFQRVESEDAWTRTGEIYFASSHVNVILGRRSADPRVHDNEKSLLTIDFIPPKDTALYRTFPISDETVIAMFMNNRAAETLAEGKLDDAYWWARSAIGQDPSFLSAYNTLAVVYKVHGNLHEAEALLRVLLAREPANLNAMTNLALVLEDEGRGAEAEALSDRIDRLQPHPPFYFFNRGKEAFERGDYAQAKKLFGRELERDPTYHEFHFWFAAACLKLGERELAREHLMAARENSNTRAEEAIYKAKLDRLNGATTILAH
ncbi:MAG: tetratricopeptide repeat protein [Bacillota bacterium]